MKRKLRASQLFAPIAALCLLTAGSASTRAQETKVAEAKTPVEKERMSYLKNDSIRLGVDLEQGGAITYLSKASDETNLINSFDRGRQIQMSHYSGPVPFEPFGKKPQEYWAFLGWNPIQVGDAFGHRARVLAHTNDGKTMYTKLVPMQWPLENVPGECTFETWISLEGNTVRVRCRMNNYRSDKTQYGGRDQELPAIYTNGPWHRLITYRGDKPWTNDATAHIPPQFPWANWTATEGWAALVNEQDEGVGVWHPDARNFIGGFAGTPGAGGPKDAPTGYIAPLHSEIIDHNIVYDYRYFLILGNLDEIRRKVYELAPRPKPPVYRFEKDRQHWHYSGAVDAGWPIQGELKITPQNGDPFLVGPTGFWQAKDAPKLYVEAAFQTGNPQVEVFWKRADDANWDEKKRMTFNITPDGKYRVYEFDLSQSPEYKGAITGIRFDPTQGARAGELIRIKSIGFSKG